MEIWRIENFCPVPIPKSSYGKFFTGDSYIILKTTALKSGAFRHDIHYWLGKDTSQDEAGTVAIKTVELDAALGGRAVQYREFRVMRQREDGRLMADSEAGEFWSFFGGFAPLPRKTATDDDRSTEAFATRLLRIEKGQPEPVQADSLLRELLDTNKCFVLDCGAEVFVWMGRSTSLEERKSASSAAEEILRVSDRPKAHVIRVIEGFETVMFRSKFEAWPQTIEVTVSEDGRGKVAALLKRQGFNVKGLLKADPLKEEPQPYIDCTGNLQVWRVNDQEKTLIPSSEQSKFYSGDCYIFHYTYPGEETRNILLAYGSANRVSSDCVQEERASALSLASKMVESLKSQAVQARFYEGKEPIQFFSIFQSFIIFKGGVSTGYKKYIADNSIEDETYSEDGVALFRIQGSGPDNMQAIQVELAATSLNSSYCYILHNGATIFTWSGSLTTTVDQDLIERQLDLIKVTEIFNFSQDDLMTEDIFILDCRSEIFVWVGQQVESKNKIQALNVGEKFLEHDFLLEKLSRETPIYVVMEGSEPTFFTRFFTWDSAKSSMHGNSFQRRLSIVKNGVTPTFDVFLVSSD
ncbi:Villin-4 [Acorus calamus]|uniref:Villin-4 n=1 Tax=Acorus calamus TaxID=4465 RepID=A0AAV9CVU4_ACOCL|nr:Villin-4 [Acorus calamus]